MHTDRMERRGPGRATALALGRLPALALAIVQASADAETRAKLEVVDAEGNDRGLNMIHWGKPWGGDYLGVPPIIIERDEDRLDFNPKNPATTPSSS